MEAPMGYEKEADDTRAAQANQADGNAVRFGEMNNADDAGDARDKPLDAAADDTTRDSLNAANMTNIANKASAASATPRPQYSQHASAQRSANERTATQHAANANANANRDGERESRAEFTTVYDAINTLQEQLDEAKSSFFQPSMARIDRDSFNEQLRELKSMLPVQLERASALMREAEKRLQSAQMQANAIIASAQNRSAQLVQEAQEQADFLVGQEHVSEVARQRARDTIETAQDKADKLVQGANHYCGTVMAQLQQQLSKYSQDVQAGLQVLQERERQAARDLN